MSGPEFSYYKLQFARSGKTSKSWVPPILYILTTIYYSYIWQTVKNWSRNFKNSHMSGFSRLQVLFASRVCL